LNLEHKAAVAEYLKGMSIDDLAWFIINGLGKNTIKTS
jgi:hypothetical protein